MSILNFSDVLKKVGLDPKEVKLIRHSLSDEKAAACNKVGMLFILGIRRSISAMIIIIGSLLLTTVAPMHGCSLATA